MSIRGAKFNSTFVAMKQWSLLPQLSALTMMRCFAIIGYWGLSGIGPHSVCGYEGMHSGQ